MATIKDVAKAANVSVATVSRVINNKGYVNEETRRLVEKAIKDLNYIPNQLARSLYNKESKLISVFVPHINTQFYSDLVDGIEEKALELGYKVMLCITKDNEQRELEYIQIVNQYNIDGIIVASNAHNAETLIKSNYPIVTVDHILSENIPSISSNNMIGGAIAAQRLIHGKANFVLELRGPSFLLTTAERSSGFRQTLIQHNVPYISYDDDLISPNLAKIEKIIKDNPQIDSIFATTDFLAINALNIVKKLGKKVPEDIQIIGFDNIRYTELVTPSLTTVSQPIKEMGKMALETLVLMLDDKQPEEFHMVLDVNLVERNSTRNGNNNY